ncbi:hypothetical protein [Devosia sp. MC521]|uniref:hypothetical protein n=1 Tax=Devosia sp. MC521 TaxID=2759954 RepID=UPI0015FB4C67|nr:hypothetical protein [Devosia sp. MC521]MBJ6986086.1 hypothetical protein [Devosia sp. MC521]QMW61455.1 hypothetical protein H4N61_10735 [Devosia sp. MC521]
MTIEERERAIAVSAWGMAAGMIEYRDPEARELARAALDRPCAATIRPLLEAGQGKPWLQSLVEALAQVGVAAAEDVLGY